MSDWRLIPLLKLIMISQSLLESTPVFYDYYSRLLLIMQHWYMLPSLALLVLTNVKLALTCVNVRAFKRYMWRHSQFRKYPQGSDCICALRSDGKGWVECDAWRILENAKKQPPILGNRKGGMGPQVRWPGYPILTFSPFAQRRFILPPLSLSLLSTA